MRCPPLTADCTENPSEIDAAETRMNAASAPVDFCPYSNQMISVCPF